MSIIRFSHVSKIYADGTQALADFDLEVADGELMALVGPSGCGKSTALRLLSGLDQPSAGEILIDGNRIDRLPPQSRNIAMVFQNYALYPHMTVRSNLAFPLKMMKLPRAEIARRVGAAAQMLELEQLLDRKPAQLSGGQRQRVAMGRAIVREPVAFLMDEPLSNLDARLRVQIRADIAALQRRIGTTTLYVTHDQVEAMTLGNRVAVMNAGRLQQVDTPQAIYERPANTFVAGFIGSPGMNLFPVRVKSDGAGMQLMLGEVALTLPYSLDGRINAIGRNTDGVITAGLRPEGFGMANDSADAIRVTVSAIETLGHEELVHFTAPWAPEHNLIARLGAPARVHTGDAIRLSMDVRRLYFFDGDGKMLCSCGD